MTRIIDSYIIQFDSKVWARYGTMMYDHRVVMGGLSYLRNDAPHFEWIRDHLTGPWSYCRISVVESTDVGVGRAHPDWEYVLTFQLEEDAVAFQVHKGV